VQTGLELVNLVGFEKKIPLAAFRRHAAAGPRSPRALSFDPTLLLMDEPFGALDEIVRDNLNEQLLRLWDKTGKTVVFVTHSIPESGVPLDQGGRHVAAGRARIHDVIALRPASRAKISTSARRRSSWNSRIGCGKGCARATPMWTSRRLAAAHLLPQGGRRCSCRA